MSACFHLSATLCLAVTLHNLTATRHVSTSPLVKSPHCHTPSCILTKPPNHILLCRQISSPPKMRNPSTTSSSSSKHLNGAGEWEIRPGGMLVQKRDKTVGDPPAMIRIRIAYGALRYEISVDSRGTFGELKRAVKGEIGLLPEEQKVVFRGKERQNGEYMENCGVRNGSKVVVMEDPASIERRCIEMCKNARLQSAVASISAVAADIDKLEHQVRVIEKSIREGIKVAEVQIATLIEMLMRQAIKLDAISAEGEASSLKTLQGKRVQKCVETLDVLKISNEKMKTVIVSTKWETFDPPLVSPPWNRLD